MNGTNNVFMNLTHSYQMNVYESNPRTPSQTLRDTQNSFFPFAIPHIRGILSHILFSIPTPTHMTGNTCSTLFVCPYCGRALGQHFLTSNPDDCTAVFRLLENFFPVVITVSLWQVVRGSEEFHHSFANQRSASAERDTVFEIIREVWPSFHSVPRSFHTPDAPMRWCSLTRARCPPELPLPLVIVPPRSFFTLHFCIPLSHH